MSYLFDANTEDISGSFVFTHGYPITLACHVKMTDWIADSRYFVNLGINTGTINDSHILWNRATIDKVAASSVDSAGLDDTAHRTFDSANQYDGVWLSIVGVFVGNADRTLYYNSISETIEDLDSRTVAETLDEIRIGNALGDNAAADALVAEVAVWGSDLSTANITSYLAGNAANTLDTANLLGYWPLATDQGTHADEGPNSGPTLTVDGATFDADHPTIAGGRIDQDFAETATILFNMEFNVIPARPVSARMQGFHQPHLWFQWGQ